MRTQLVTWRSSLYTALGLAAFACGGQTGGTDNSTPTGSGGSGGAGTGGSGGVSGTGSGGSSASGGSAGSGGSGGYAGDAGRGGAGGSVAGAGGMGGIDFACQNPAPVIGVDGKETGFVSCDAGFMHRPERRTCASIVPRPDPVHPPWDAGAGCTSDQDCAQLPYGHCVVSASIDPAPYASCIAGCVRDEDCDPHSICVCGDPVGRCVAATCSTDADCASGFACVSIPQVSPCGGSYPSDFACQKPDDTCRGSSDCRVPSENCQNTTTGRKCGSSGACGRPFLVEGAPRQASIATGSGWAVSVAPALGASALHPATRVALAEHWSKNGLMEHASVAAFARFTLELLALGAPASLVHAAQQALGDEIAHAELCFGLAGSYAGQAIEPGPLPIHGALDDLSFDQIVSTAIAEACIGETLAAAEAAEACAHVRDPHVRGVLERIAADEARHAELGWKFLRWALATTTPAVREQLRRHTLRLVGTELEHAFEPKDQGPDLREHGVLGSQLKSEVRRSALKQLITPLARALFEAAPALHADC